MTSQFAVNKKKRPPFGWWQMLVAVVLLIGVMILLFPKKSFVDLLVSNHEPSAVSISYLKNMVDNDPTNRDLRMNLAQQQFKMGQIQEAKTTISSVISFAPSSDFQWNVLWLYYLITRVEAFQLKEKSPDRLEKEAKLRALQIVLARSPLLPTNKQQILANDALAFEQPSVANYLDKKIMAQSKQPVAFYAEAGKTALYVKDFQGSADFYRLAMEKSGTLEDKRLYYTKALVSLSAAGTDEKALEFAQKNIDGLAKDKSTLIYLTKLALRAGQQKIAAGYINQLLQLKYQDSTE